MPNNKKDSLTPQQVLQLAQQLQSTGKDEQPVASALQELLLKRMAPEQAKAMQAMLQNQQAIETMLASEQAKALREKLGL